MAKRHRQSNRKRRNETMVGLVLVAHAEHAKHQHETEEELDAETLQRQQVGRQPGVADVGHILGQQSVQGSRTSNRATALDDDVQNGAHDGDVAGGQHSACNSRIQVTATNVANRL